MRIIYAGSPSIAVPCLEALAKMDGVELAGVLTNPDTAKGRSGSLQPTEIGEAAQKLIIPVLKPQKLDSAAREEAALLKPDLLVSFAYGRIFGPKFLSLFPLGGVNIHPSLLPKYRGPSPIQAAILNRDNKTGISIQKLALEVDSGNILAQEEFPLTGEETTESLSGTVALKAALLLPKALAKITAQDDGVSQNHAEASYCSEIKREDGIIDWSKEAVVIDAQIRSFTPWPLSRTIHNGRELFILKAEVYSGSKSFENAQAGLVIGKDDGILIQTGCGVLSVKTLQYQGKKALFWKDFLNGARDFIGSNLM